MTKIESIQICDFRIYNGQHEFSFGEPSKLSNLLVIYAPNGFGKTSFFDAVEWCYSSKIRRFENEVLLQEINRRDYSSGDKILLTNRKSFRSGKSGKVSIKTSNGKTVVRTASERKATNQNFKYDYRTASQLNSELSEQVLNQLVKTNILTQDQIDEFLRHTKPDQRFVQLNNFWPEGENAVSILQMLDSYLNMLSLEKESIEQGILQATQKINEYLSADDQIAPLNNAIDELTRGSSTGFNIQPFNDSVNEQTYKTALDAVRTFIERTRLLIESVSAEILKLEALRFGLPEYNRSVSAKSEIESFISALISLEKLNTDLTNLTILHGTLETNLGSKTISQERSLRLFDIFDDFDEINLNIQGQQKIAEECRISIGLQLQKIDDYRASSQTLQSTLVQWKEHEEALQKTLATWDSDLAEYKFWVAAFELSRSKTIELKSLMDVNLIALNEKIERRQALKQILEEKDYLQLPEKDIQPQFELFKKRNDHIRSIDETRNLIKDLGAEFDRATSLEETFDRILVWGEQYIKNTNSKHCPLCASEFADVTILLEKIEAQKSDNSNTVALKEKADLAKSREQDLLERLSLCNFEIENYIRVLLETCNLEISNLQMQRDSLSSELTTTESSLSHAKDASSKFSTILQSNSDTIDLDGEMEFDVIRYDMEQKLKVIGIKILRLTNVVSAKRELISRTENEVSIKRNQISIAENNVQIFRTDQRLIEANQLVQDLGLSNIILDKSILENTSKDIAVQRANIQSKLQETYKQIVEVQEQIKASAIKVGYAELPGLRFEKQRELEHNVNVINNYTTQLATFTEIERPLEDFISKALVVRQMQKGRLIAELKSQEELFIKLQVIEKNVAKNTFQQQLNELNHRLVPAEKARAKVVAARRTAEEYINDGINKYFNQEVINQIYSRIEPHPDLNRITITPKVSDGGPMLDIKAISNDEELAPSLYLSAGQLNVLSLSIFLAKAFETKSGEIDTIFMDDPIQNLSDINVLSFIDLIRTMITKYDRQIVISSHDANFYKLMRNKMPSESFNVRYYEIDTFGNAKHVP